MKKNLISIIALIVVALISNNVYAASTGSVTLNASKSTVKAQEEFTVVLKATDSNNLNTVEYSGIKVTDENGNVSNAITVKSVDVIGDWAQMSYDGKTAYVYSGSMTQAQDVCKITFVVVDNITAGRYNINVEDIIVYSTNILDDTTTIGDKVVAIEVEADGNNAGDNTGDNSGEGNTGDNAGDNTGDNIGDNTGDNTNKEEDNKQDNTASEGNKLPQTGVENVTVIAIMALTVVSVVSYLSYKKYKNI